MTPSTKRYTSSRNRPSRICYLIFFVLELVHIWPMENLKAEHSRNITFVLWTSVACIWITTSDNEKNIQMPGIQYILTVEEHYLWIAVKIKSLSLYMNFICMHIDYTLVEKSEAVIFPRKDSIVLNCVFVFRTLFNAHKACYVILKLEVRTIPHNM